MFDASLANSGRIVLATDFMACCDRPLDRALSLVQPWDECSREL